MQLGCYDPVSVVLDLVQPAQARADREDETKAECAANARERYATTYLRTWGARAACATFAHLISAACAVSPLLRGRSRSRSRG